MKYKLRDYQDFFGILDGYDFRASAFYGGVYIDDEGTICIKYVGDHFEDTSFDSLSVKTNLPVRFEKANNGYQKLSELCAEITDKSSNISCGIVGVGIDERNNRISLAVTADFHDDGVLFGRDLFSIELFVWLRNDSSLQPSDSLSDGNSYIMTGYPVRNSNKARGVVTAGHMTDVEKGKAVYFNGEKIGSISDFEVSDVMDAAVVELVDSCKCLDTVSMEPYPHICGLSPQLICGAAVEMYSANNGAVQTGRVVYPSFSFMKLKDIIICSYSASAGDSGAPILIPFPSGERALVGIHLGTFMSGGQVYSYGRTAASINARFSLDLDVTKNGSKRKNM